MWQFISAVLFVVATSMISHYLVKKSLTPWNGEMFLISNYHEQKLGIVSRLTEEHGGKIFSDKVVTPTGFHRDICLPEATIINSLMFSESTCEKMPFIRIALKKGSVITSVGWRIAVSIDEVDMCFEEPVDGSKFDCLCVIMESQLNKRVYTINFNA
ncbi:MAG: hypothetical protein WC631_03285 [Candidatus Paceibacterota bacterium]|jgi:hypothetical protein